ncbi:hypothetical protein CERZMDRAFT_53114, partial [Cercospora zeae-maydis SCOH1-5]
VFDSILVIIDRLSKIALYILAIVKDFAKSFFENIVVKYDTLIGIILDRGSLFTSNF